MPREFAPASTERGHDAFTEAVLALVADIPPGRVMSYGDVAACLGSRAARRVGRILAAVEADVPWWRVVRASNLPPLGLDARALPHYEAEATPLAASAPGTGYRIARHARWMPS